MAAQAEHAVEYAGHPADQVAVQAVSIPEAAQTLGVSIITIRRRIKRGELRGQRLKTPQGFEWRVVLPAQLIDAAAAQADTPDGQAGAQPHALPGADAPDPRLIGALEAHNATLQDEVATLRTELDARRREVQALLALLAQSQQRLLEAPAPVTREHAGEEAAPQRGEQATSTPEEYAAPEQSSSSERPIKWWSRVRGWLHGA